MASPSCFCGVFFSCFFFYPFPHEIDERSRLAGWSYLFFSQGLCVTASLSLSEAAWAAVPTGFSSKHAAYPIQATALGAWGKLNGTRLVSRKSSTQLISESCFFPPSLCQEFRNRESKSVLRVWWQKCIVCKTNKKPNKQHLYGTCQAAKCKIYVKKVWPVVWKRWLCCILFACFLSPSD